MPMTTTFTPPTPAQIMAMTQEERNKFFDKVMSLPQHPLKEKKILGLEKIKDTLTQEELLRFGYIPFVIAHLVWDYADTILDLCSLLRLRTTKKLCRAVKALKQEYDSQRLPYIDKWHEDCEERNMAVYEDAVSEIANLHLVNINCYIEREYPELSTEYRHLIRAVYQCRVLLRALFRYTNKQSEIVGKRLGWRLSNVLPESLQRLEPLLVEFTGDKRLSGEYDQIEERFVATFEAQMRRIELTDVPH